MQESNLKNMIVLKNIPSNIIDEAIIVLKENKMARKFEKIETSKKIINTNQKEKEKNYVIREAEMIVSNYITDKEKNKQIEEQVKNKNLKYNRLKKYAIISTIIIIIQTILNIIIK